MERSFMRESWVTTTGSFPSSSWVSAVASATKSGITFGKKRPAIFSNSGFKTQCQWLRYEEIEREREREREGGEE